MVLTEWGYLLLFLCGLSVFLFCWLSYASLSQPRDSTPSADQPPLGASE